MKVEPLTLEDVEFIFLQVQNGYAGILTQSSILIEQTYKGGGELKNGITTIFKDNLEGAQRMYDKLSEIDLKKITAGKLILEINLNLIPRIMMIMETAIMTKNASKEAWNELRLIMNIMRMQGILFSSLLTMCGVTLVREYGRKDALSFIQKKEKELEKTLKYKELMYPLVEIDKTALIEQDAYDRFVSEGKKLQKFVRIYEKNYTELI